MCTDAYALMHTCPWGCEAGRCPCCTLDPRDLRSPLASTDCTPLARTDLEVDLVAALLLIWHPRPFHGGELTDGVGARNATNVCHDAKRLSHVG